ncbi:MAG: dihydroorotate dehydrogenase electron transfer subunit [candidate division WOR-3 bacterium]
MKQLTATVTDVQRLTKDIFSIWLNAAELAQTAKPGQFVNIRVGEGEELLLRRPVSIADVFGQKVRLIFRIVGKGTAWLSQVPKGCGLDLLGPLGRPVRIPKGRDILVCGGGVGAAPLLFLTRRLARQNRVYVVLGAKSRKEMILVREFKRLRVKGYIATNDGSLGWKGTASELAELVANELNRPIVYACGPRPMLQDIVARLPGHEIWGFAEERMGCGTGICHCCALARKDGGYIRLCRDGPVVLLNGVRL